MTESISQFRGSRTAGAMVMASWFYPFALLWFLHATWLIAWGVLGHRPLPMIDDPKYISVWVDVSYFITVLLLVAFPVAFLAGFPVILFSKPKRAGGVLKATLRVGSYLAIWAVTVLMLRADPMRIIYWFMD